MASELRLREAWCERPCSRHRTIGNSEMIQTNPRREVRHCRFLLPASDSGYRPSRWAPAAYPFSSRGPQGQSQLHHAASAAPSRAGSCPSQQCLPCGQASRTDCRVTPQARADDRAVTTPRSTERAMLTSAPSSIDATTRGKEITAVKRAETP